MKERREEDDEANDFLCATLRAPAGTLLALCTGVLAVACGTTGAFMSLRTVLDTKHRGFGTTALGMEIQNRLSPLPHLYLL